ncbi:arsenate reductase family protein [Exiguobacterium algae]|uniref:arsenate reductase family protein n=1 Tax=Exiguobacterium algae TaxID=2751250 RepID=UPI001BE61983|nr:arsenate reductase family protein [Exiguobacterium algae]
MLTVYGYPPCSTCKKAEKWLKEQGIDYTYVHIVESTPSKEELAKLWEQSGQPLKKFFNTSGQVYRNEGIKDKLPNLSEDEQLELLSSNGMLLKRPIVSNGEKTTVGFSEKSFTEVWGEVL